MNDFAEQYKNATDEFLNLVSSISEKDLDKTDLEGWSPRQVIHHMADSEAQSYARLRRLIAEPGSTIQGYDESKWAEDPTLGYKSEAIDTPLDVIKSVRKSSYELLKRLNEDSLNNSGTHTETGKYTVKDWLNSYVNHPIDHANQIRSQLGRN